MCKKIGLLFLAICVASGLLFQSCKKETTEVNMIIRNWTLVSKTVAGVNIATDCDTDSKWNFKTDETYVIKDNCDETLTGTWSLADDGKTLTLDDITAYKVIENSVTKLVIEMQVGEIGLIRWSFN
ncbi:MAG: lipocalin family protein [Salinivirgaceae bacterium]|nr:lipocalin family protein [Salinivirgaceae bacterium]MDD4746435.1 lipocalin family protein [Salinivirgaceae bacterium]MDY0281009.1 lipocalin family protein [Salinivirgaceae bacterium]